MFAKLYKINHGMKLLNMCNIIAFNSVAKSQEKKSSSFPNLDLPKSRFKISKKCRLVKHGRINKAMEHIQSM